MQTPDQAFVEEVLAHGRKQLEKGWTPLSTAGNLCARYGLTDDCGRRVVGVMMASRVGPSVEHLAGELATALKLSKEEATARVLEVKKGLVDLDDWSSMHLEFDPERAPSYVPASSDVPAAADQPASPDVQATIPASPSATSGHTTGLRGPIRLEVNLLGGEEGHERRKKRGLFRRGH